ncbi:NUDIX hydrolase [Pseudomonas orientalis]|uniref:NUDIX hydrolase n=1 Tax=Pseudomonas orientalis TaxID=76758 RepID=UPI0034D79C8B
MPSRRFASRILLINPSDQLLLFKISYKCGALAGLSYWATPGGKLKDGESFEQAAIRELEEETGIAVQSVSNCIARREFSLVLPDRQAVLAVENYYTVRVAAERLARAGWSDAEREAICEVKWWSVKDLTTCCEQVFPPDLPSLYAQALTALRLARAL